MTKLKFSKRLLPIPIMLIVFFLIFYFAYTDIKQRTIKEFNNEQFILAQTASQGITSYFEEALADMTFLSQIKSIVEFNTESNALIANYYESHKDLIEAVTRVDAQGIIMFTYPLNNSVIGMDIRYQKHVQQVIDTQKPVISDVFRSVQGYLAIALHVPVFEGKEYKGSLALLIPIDKIGKHYLDKIKIRGTGNIWLLSEDGVEIYCPVSDHKGKTFFDNTRNETAAVELMKKIKSSTSGTAKSVHTALGIDRKSGFIEKYMVFYRVPIRNTYWTILMSYQEEDVYKALAQLRNRLILTFLLLFLFVSYYFYSLAKVRNLLKEEAKRRIAEAKLREKEIQYQNLANSSPALIWTSGTDKLCNYFNQTWLAFTGRTLEQEMGNGWAEGVHPDDFDRCLETYVTAFDRHEAFEMEYRLKHNSGEYLWILDLGTPNYNSNGEFVGFIGNCFDISDRKRAEDEILMLAQSLKSVNECVSITDMEDKILFVNEAFLNTYGYTAEEVTGKHLGFIRSSNNSPEIANEILPTTLTGSWKGELLNIRKDGSEFPVYLSTTGVKDKDGKIISLIGVASDITERKHTEKELINAKEKAEESDRLKSAFLANMSHEIRTPMNGILGFSELLKMPGLTGDQQQEFIDMIKKSGKRMLNIINDIVDISKIESGQMEVSVSETAINEQVEFVYSFFKHEAEQKGIELSCETGLSSATSIIKTDKEKVYAILINLVKNAIKYSDTGAIKFGYILKGANLEFYVKDTGIGIPEDRIHAIFDRFVQADIADTRAFQGAGLGLSISKAYVEMLGGKIWVESEEGKGSTFYFTIPYSIVDHEFFPANTPAPVFSETQSGKKLKILIAEDDEASEMLIALAVKEVGNEVIKVGTGIEAVEACRSNPDIDLVLMDIQMPLMNGYEAARQIRQFNTDIIIIAQTAYGLAGDREKAQDAGCNDYISKPIEIKVLNELIKKYFQ